MYQKLLRRRPVETVPDNAVANHLVDAERVGAQFTQTRLNFGVADKQCLLHFAVALWLLQRLLLLHATRHRLDKRAQARENLQPLVRRLRDQLLHLLHCFTHKIRVAGQHARGDLPRERAHSLVRVRDSRVVVALSHRPPKCHRVREVLATAGPQIVVVVRLGDSGTNVAHLFR